MNSIAYYLGISITFTSFPFLRSPRMVSISGPNLIVTITLTPLKLRIRIISTSLSREPKLLQSASLALFLFLSFLVPSLRIKGQLAIFLMTAFCFFHSCFSLSASQSDFFSCNLLSNLAFSTQIFWSCFLRKLELRLLFILSLSLQPQAVLLFMVVVIFSRRSRLARYISVNLSSKSIFFLPLFRKRIYYYLPVVFGRTFFILYKYPSICTYYSLFLSTFLPIFRGLNIQIYFIKSFSHQSPFLIHMLISLIKIAMVSQYIQLPFLQYKRREMQGGHHASQRGVQRKRAQIRKKIRRQQIDKYFEDRRKELLIQECQSSKYVLRHELMSAQGRSSFLISTNKALQQTSPSNWRPILEEISMSLSYFNKNIEEWTQIPIFDKMAQTVQSQMAEFGIQHIVIKIFTSILTYIEQVPSKVVNRIQSTHMIENSVAFVKIVQLPLEHEFQFLYFFAILSRISYKIRDYILQVGGGSLLEAFGKKILSESNFNEQMRFKFLGICSDFLNILPSKSIRRYPDLSFVLQILPTIFDMLETGGSDRIVNNALICLLLVVKSKKQIYYQKFISHQILYHLFELTKNSLFRNKSLNILSYLASSESSEVVRLLRKLGIRDLLYEANCSSNDFNLRILTLTMLDNLTLSEEEVRQLIGHKVWGIACESLTYNNHDVRFEAYHLINAIITAIDMQSFKLEVYKENRLIDIAISQIQDFKKWSPEITIQALNLLRIYMQLESSRKHFQSFNIFESVYRLSQILQRVAEQSTNEKVIEKATIVFNKYLQDYMDNCTN